MAKAKADSKEPKTENVETTKAETQSPEAEQSYILATGLEDYGRWKTMFKDHQRDKNEKPFRRGRIWC